jgi:hypothetical protein
MNSESGSLVLQSRQRPVRLSCLLHRVLFMARFLRAQGATISRLRGHWGIGHMVKITYPIQVVHVRFVGVYRSRSGDPLCCTQH